MKPETTEQKQDTRFKPGQSGNPAGRPKGSRNKVSEKFLEALALDFDRHGKNVIETVRAEKPHEYLKIVASLVPKQMEIENSVQPFAVIPEQFQSIDAWEKAFTTQRELPAGEGTLGGTMASSIPKGSN